MKFKLSNIWKAGISTFTGLATGTVITIATALAEGKFDAKGLYVGLGVAFFMAISDMLKEVKKEIDEQK